MQVKAGAVAALEAKPQAGESPAAGGDAAPATSTVLSPPTAALTADGVGALLRLLAGDIPYAVDMPASPPGFPTPQVAGTSPSATALTVAPLATDSPVSGEHLMSWLKNGIQSRKLIINDAKALVHTVSGTAFLHHERLRG